jgi:hypothetical protein
MSAHSDVNNTFLSGLVFGFDVGTSSIGYERMLERDLDMLDGWSPPKSKARWRNITTGRR